MQRRFCESRYREGHAKLAMDSSQGDGSILVQRQKLLLLLLPLLLLLRLLISNGNQGSPG